MSSECRCHESDWCFFCEMFLPLEKEVERLKGLYEDERAWNSAIGVEREEWAKESKRLRTMGELAVQALERIKTQSICKGEDCSFGENCYAVIAGSTIQDIQRISTEGVSQ